MFYSQRFSFPCPSVFIQRVIGLKKNKKEFCSKHMSRSGGWAQGSACTRHFCTGHLLIGNNSLLFLRSCLLNHFHLFSTSCLYQIKWPCERNYSWKWVLVLPLKCLENMGIPSPHEDGTELNFPCCSPCKLIFYKGYFKQGKIPFLKEITKLWLSFFNKKWRKV